MKATTKGSKESRRYQLKVTLDGIEPPIWRRLIVPSDINMFKLHEVLQVAMGWTNSHLHQFVAGKTCYGIPDDEVEGPEETKDERRYTLEQLAKGKGAKLVYEYDFGDGWEHLIIVEDVLRPVTKPAYSECLGGARACPPEDVGSVPGYENFLEAIKDPKHPEHEEMLEWVGQQFDPEVFSVDDVNEQLADLRKHRSLSLHA